MATEVRVTSPARLSKTVTTASYVTGVVAGTSTYVMRNDGRTIFRFYKTGANPCTVTVTATGYIKGAKAADWTFIVPASTGDVFVGPFEPLLFNDAWGDMRFSLSEATAIFFMPMTVA